MTESKQEVAFRYAVERVNANRKILTKSLLSAQLEKIPPQDSFHASKRGIKLQIMCVQHFQAMVAHRPSILQLPIGDAPLRSNQCNQCKIQVTSAPAISFAQLQGHIQLWAALYCCAIAVLSSMPTRTPLVPHFGL